MSSFNQFTRELSRRQAPVARDTRFTTAWRDATGRSYGISGPTERLISTVSKSSGTYRRKH